MAIFCNTQTTVERQYFSVIKKHIKFCTNLGHIDGQLPWYIGSPDLFIGNHLLATRKPGSECYVIHHFIGTIVVCSEYCALLDAVRRLRIERNSTENLRWLIRDVVATWVSEHLVQKTSIADFWTNIAYCISTEFCQYDTLAKSQN